ncbi:MAG: magnesium chelatase subunit D [Hyphomicrobiaceae bacterium]|nr:magnesium chelatase subunit D [Hyphomicrobiaceae bacterium]
MTRGATMDEGVGLGASEPWDDALTVASLLAVDLLGLRGVRLRGLPGPAREAWLTAFGAVKGADAPLRRLPASIDIDRLIGGLDLSRTLAAGRPVAQKGLIAEADGGWIVAAMAERMEPQVAAELAKVLDTGEVVAERDGIGLRTRALIAVIALDEALPDEAGLSAGLADRLAFDLDLAGVRPVAATIQPPSFADIAAARARLGAVVHTDEMVACLVTTALALGIGSLRAPLLALKAARASAALAGRDAVTADDVMLAARLVLAPRATCLPACDSEDHPPEPPEDDQHAADDEPLPPPDDLGERPLEDIVLDAIAAALPPDLLARLGDGDATRTPGPTGGASGAQRAQAHRGRVVGARPGKPVGGARLAVLDTLRAAAPWQRVRATGGPHAVRSPDLRRIAVRPEDFRIKRFRQRTGSTTIFLVDASGSSALNRLAEAKGAVEMLLADCYVRRDEVALIAFRGQTAELLLPPTRALVRAKRCLAALPAGGGTPLANGLDAALALALVQRRKGLEPALVLLTDGAPNIGRDGAPGRPQAQDDAVASARQARSVGLRALIIDTAQRQQAFSQRLADAMGAVLVQLPRTDARGVTDIVRSTFTQSGRA